MYILQTGSITCCAYLFKKIFYRSGNFVVPFFCVMNLPKYPIFASEEKHEYGFFSEGPMGKIRKVVRYEKIGNDLFNLGFGDWDEGLQGANDSNRSNNEDRDKVLNTVASTAIVFTNQFPNAQLFVEGSTLARTRLYQMGIAHNLL